MQFNVFNEMHEIQFNQSGRMIDPLNTISRSVTAFLGYLGLEKQETGMVEGLEGAKAAIEKGNFRQAVDILTQLLEMEGSRSHRAQLYYLRSRACFKIQRIPQAEVDIRNALHLDSSNADFLLELGRLCTRQGRFSEALEIFERVGELNPQNSDVFNCKGLLFSRIGDYDLAKYNYKQALILQPESAIVYNNLGVLSLQEGDKKQAIHYLGMAIQIDPKLKAPRRNRSWLLEKQQKPERKGELLCSPTIIDNIQFLCSFHRNN